MDKYGRENFSFEIICVGNKEYILELEVKAISAYKTRNKSFGYNIKEGGQSGRGYSVGGSKRDVPVFVSGWWFPNRRTALSKLGISVDVYKNRKKRNTLGQIKQDYEVLPNGGVIKFTRSYKYYAGFWFPSYKLASDKLNQKISLIKSRVSRGHLEQFVPERRGGKKAELNHMFNIDPKEHPSSISVIIYGIFYDSIKQATAATGYSKYIINSRIKQKHPDFNYA